MSENEDHLKCCQNYDFDENGGNEAKFESLTSLDFQRSQHCWSWLQRSALFSLAFLQTELAFLLVSQSLVLKVWLLQQVLNPVLLIPLYLVLLLYSALQLVLPCLALVLTALLCLCFLPVRLQGRHFYLNPILFDITIWPLQPVEGLLLLGGFTVGFIAGFGDDL